MMHETEEMYLKTILKLSREKGTVQAVDIAAERGFARSTVSVAVKSLLNKGLIHIDESNAIFLTPEGKKQAEHVGNKFNRLKDFFMLVGADEKLAEEDACKIEHCISDEICGLIALYAASQEHKKKTMRGTDESAEMYLETILRLEANGNETNLSDVGRIMKVSKAAVCKARQKLFELGLITYDKHNMHLTPSGREIAEKVYEKHLILTRLFRQLGVPAELAEEDACRIEHIISDDTFEVLKNHGESKAQVHVEG